MGADRRSDAPALQNDRAMVSMLSEISSDLTLYVLMCVMALERKRIHLRG